jgi:hypothetical protein
MKNKEEKLTLKTIGALYRSAKKHECEEEFYIEKFKGIFIDLKFPFFHKFVSIQLKSQPKLLINKGE